MTDNAKVKALAYSPNAIEAALAPLKGSENGPLTFEAVAPAFSAYIASRGNKVELSATSATARVFQRLLASTTTVTKTGKESIKFTLNTSIARAFRACCIKALKDYPARANSQEGHDSALLALSAVWCSFFMDAPAPKAKPEGYETPTQIVARLTAEIVGLKIERDALQAALQAVKVPSMA